jgi:hypothetical protein
MEGRKLWGQSFKEVVSEIEEDSHQQPRNPCTTPKAQG